MAMQEELNNFKRNEL
jgi:hypothetical protein